MYTHQRLVNAKFEILVTCLLLLVLLLLWLIRTDSSLLLLLMFLFLFNNCIRRNKTQQATTVAGRQQWAVANANFQTGMKMVMKYLVRWVKIIDT